MDDHVVHRMFGVGYAFILILAYAGLVLGVMLG